jgi:hypothetical protein
MIKITVQKLIEWTLLIFVFTIIALAIIMLSSLGG